LRERRDSTRIIFDILSISKGGALKTEIVYQANLNFQIIKPYLSFLIEEGLIHLNDENELPTYELTTKGEELLETIARVQDALSGILQPQRKKNTMAAKSSD
jgi:predicted transcriptional regulator